MCVMFCKILTSTLSFSRSGYVEREAIPTIASKRTDALLSVKCNANFKFEEEITKYIDGCTGKVVGKLIANKRKSPTTKTAASGVKYIIKPCAKNIAINVQETSETKLRTQLQFLTALKYTHLKTDNKTCSVSLTPRCRIKPLMDKEENTRKILHKYDQKEQKDEGTVASISNLKNSTHSNLTLPVIAKVETVTQNLTNEAIKRKDRKNVRAHVIHSDVSRKTICSKGKRLKVDRLNNRVNKVRTLGRKLVPLLKKQDVIKNETIEHSPLISLPILASDSDVRAEKTALIFTDNFCAEGIEKSDVSIANICPNMNTTGNIIDSVSALNSEIDIETENKLSRSNCDANVVDVNSEMTNTIKLLDKLSVSSPKNNNVFGHSPDAMQCSVITSSSPVNVSNSDNITSFEVKATMLEKLSLPSNSAGNSNLIDDHKGNNINKAVDLIDSLIEKNINITADFESENVPNTTIPSGKKHDSYIFDRSNINHPKTRLNEFYDVAQGNREKSFNLKPIPNISSTKVKHKITNEYNKESVSEESSEFRKETEEEFNETIRDVKSKTISEMEHGSSYDNYNEYISDINVSPRDVSVISKLPRKLNGPVKKKKPRKPIVQFHEVTYKNPKEFPKSTITTNMNHDATVEDEIASCESNTIKPRKASKGISKSVPEESPGFCEQIKKNVEETINDVKTKTVSDIKSRSSQGNCSEYVSSINVSKSQDFGMLKSSIKVKEPTIKKKQRKSLAKFDEVMHKDPKESNIEDKTVSYGDNSVTPKKASKKMGDILIEIKSKDNLFETNEAIKNLPGNRDIITTSIGSSRPKRSICERSKSPQKVTMLGRKSRNMSDTFFDVSHNSAGISPNLSSDKYINEKSSVGHKINEKKNAMKLSETFSESANKKKETSKHPKIHVNTRPKRQSRSILAEKSRIHCRQIKKRSVTLNDTCDSSATKNRIANDKSNSATEWNSKTSVQLRNKYQKIEANNITELSGTEDILRKGNRKSRSIRSALEKGSKESPIDPDPNSEDKIVFEDNAASDEIDTKEADSSISSSVAELEKEHTFRPSVKKLASMVQQLRNRVQ